jgi:hypothetical protein
LVARRFRAARFFAAARFFCARSRLSQRLRAARRFALPFVFAAFLRHAASFALRDLAFFADALRGTGRVVAIAGDGVAPCGDGGPAAFGAPGPRRCGVSGATGGSRLDPSRLTCASGEAVAVVDVEEPAGDRRHRAVRPDELLARRRADPGEDVVEKRPAVISEGRDGTFREEDAWPPVGTRTERLWLRRTFDQDVPGVTLPPPRTGETGVLSPQPNTQEVDRRPPRTHPRAGSGGRVGEV